jgi:hypothetical protein
MDMTLNQNAAAEMWRPVILTFESACSFDNPFLDVEIWAEFTGPSGRVIRREAYWDGERIYRVSFAPTELGAWSYVIEAPEQTGLNGRTGNVEAVPYEGELDLYRHGFIALQTIRACLPIQMVRRSFGWAIPIGSLPTARAGIRRTIPA